MVRNNNPELAAQRISLMLVKSAVSFCSKTTKKFSRSRLSDTSVYVSEYRRYALSRDM